MFLTVVIMNGVVIMNSVVIMKGGDDCIKNKHSCASVFIGTTCYVTSKVYNKKLYTHLIFFKYTDSGY